MQRSPVRAEVLSARPGFTLLEMIVVLLLMSILALVVVSSLGNDPSPVVGRAESVKSHLRYAQTKAMNTGPLFEDQHVWGVSFRGDNTSYFIFHCTDPSACVPSSNMVHAPGEDGGLVQVGGEGVSLTGNQLLAFDRFGRPFSDAALNSTLGSVFTLTVSDGSGNSRSVTVLPETGLIE